jgi:cytochrome c2
MSRMLSALTVVASVAFTGCDLSGRASLENRRVADGDPARGRAVIAAGAYGCVACHDIPGIRMPKGVVGPPLGGMARRSFIAGTLPNTPDVLIAFLQNPPALVPETGMPDVRLRLDEARDIAAFLYVLEPFDER